MRKYCLKNSLLGNYYPMFISNTTLGSSVYLYRVVSPGLSSKSIPQVSLEKAAEITKKGDPCADEDDMHSMDVLIALLDPRGDLPSMEKKSVEYLKGILKKENPSVYYRDENLFPTVDMGMDNNMQKSIIVNLRDELRWKCYRFFGERLVDILWTPTKFATFKIVEDSEKLSLIPVALYDNKDISMKNPIKCSFDNVEKLGLVFKGKTKNSDMNRAIKQLEWKSFDRQEIANK